MDISVVLAEVYGGILVLVGLTALNKKYMDAVLEGLASSKALAWLTGIITFTVGIVVVAQYNVWSSDWRVLITIFGWLTLLKGVLITLFPDGMMRFYRKFAGASIMAIGGVIAILLGLVLIYFALTA